MASKNIEGEREVIEALRADVVASIEAAEVALDSQLLLKPAIDWLSEMAGHLEELEDALDSDDESEPLSEDEAKELLIWAESFSDCLNDGDGIVGECVPGELSPEVESLLDCLIGYFIDPVYKAGWLLYHASIGAA